MKTAMTMMMAVLLVGVFACSDARDPTGAETQSAQVGECVADIHVACGEHMMEVFLSADDMDRVAVLEAEHYEDVKSTLNDFYAYLHQVHQCVDSDGQTPDTGDLYMAGIDAWRTTLIHKWVMLDISDLDAAHAEERSYQLDMEQVMQNLRDSHDALDLIAADLDCPDPATVPYMPQPAPWAYPVGPASE